jgi:signal transduction histidine kinase
MNKTNFIIILLLCLSCCTSAYAYDRNALTANMLEQLRRKPPYPEQVKLLHNIIDLCQDTRKSHSYNAMLFNIAKAHHDVPVQLEAIRNHSLLLTDSLPMFINYIKTLPASNDRNETAAFLQYMYASKTFGLKSNKEASNYLVHLIKLYKTEKGNDIYSQAGKLLVLLSALSYVSTNDLFNDYLGKLSKVIDRLPADGRNCLPNTYYSLAPSFYSRHNMEKESLTADLKFLKFVDGLENKYRKEGRIYRNFDIFRFTIYRRMLTDTTYLSQAEIKNLFKKIMQLSKTNIEVHNELVSPRSITMINYYISTRQILKAKPYIDHLLTKNDSSDVPFLRRCLENRIKIGIMIHDKDLLKYTLQYINVLESDISNNVNEKAQELQIIYDVNGLTQQVNELELDKKQEEVDSSNRNTIISIAALVIVLILLFFTWKQLLRSKRLAVSLKQSQHDLIEEKSVIMDTMDKLEKARNDAVMADRMKTLFIQNMDHEIRTPLNAIVGFTQVITDPDIELENDEKAEYAQLILKNNDLLLKLVSDVFDIAQMESGSIHANTEDCSLNDICKKALSGMITHADKDVAMIFAEHNQDFTIKTDRLLVLQLLGNFLSNACKFTHHGKIELDYSVDESSKTVTFSVTDTGIGIPAEKAETVFDRFEKLNAFEQGTGLGLHVCKLIAKTLHGKVSLDTGYTSGSRFVFTCPLST